MLIVEVAGGAAVAGTGLQLLLVLLEMRDACAKEVAGPAASALLHLVL